MLHLAPASGENTRIYPCHDGSEIVANVTDHTYVLLRTPSKGELLSLLADFRKRQLVELKSILRRIPERVRMARRVASVGLPVGLANSDYLSRGSKTLNFFYVCPSVVNKAIGDLGLDRSYPAQLYEQAIYRVRRLAPNDAVALLDRVLGDTPKDFLNGIAPKLAEWRLLIDLEIETDLHAASDPLAFLDKLCCELNDFVAGKRTAVAKNRPIGRYMLAKALHHAGLLLFPRNVWGILYDAIPRVFDGIYPNLLVAPEGARFYTGFVGWVAAHSDASDSVRKGYLKAFRFLDHTSTLTKALGINHTFFRDYNQWDRENKGNLHAATGFKYIWRYLHQYRGVDIADDLDSLWLAGKIKLRR
jgi:hypothetical protein